MPWQEPPLWEVTVCAVLLCLAVGVVTLAAAQYGDSLTGRLRGGGAHRGVGFQREPRLPDVMKLRFSARGDDPDRIVHLTVLDTLRLGDIVRRRGEALCRPKTSLPNLEPLSRQLLDGRRCCPECIDLMARVRIRQRVDLPAASGVVAADLIRSLAQEREASRAPRRRALPDRD
ncbi:MAG: hypothetical protein ISP90_00300 [Nevskia sp.]|nr:hypothetical protein [Nevskia sp.]